MLLQQIVGVMDKELDRLRTLRSIVSGLEGTFSLEFAEAQPRVAEPERPTIVGKGASMPETPPAKRRRAARTTARPVRESAKARAVREAREARALATTIPAGPVVVMPAALAKEIAARRESHPVSPRQQEAKPEPGTLGSMIRALRLDATA